MLERLALPALAGTLRRSRRLQQLDHRARLLAALLRVNEERDAVRALRVAKLGMLRQHRLDDLDVAEHGGCEEIERGAVLGAGRARYLAVAPVRRRAETRSRSRHRPSPTTPCERGLLRESRFTASRSACEPTRSSLTSAESSCGGRSSLMPPRARTVFRTQAVSSRVTLRKPSRSAVIGPWPVTTCSAHPSRVSVYSQTPSSRFLLRVGHRQPELPDLRHVAVEELLPCLPLAWLLIRHWYVGRRGVDRVPVKLTSGPTTC